MNLDRITIALLAERLENCELEARDTTKITDDHPDMDWEDAYAVQDAIRARKLARGARIVGLKAGLTSRATMGAKAAIWWPAWCCNRLPSCAATGATQRRPGAMRIWPAP